MQIVTLTSIFNFIAAIVCFITTIKMYFVSRKNPNNLNIRYYFFSFIFITIYLFVNSLPLLLLKDSYSVSVFTSLFRPFLLLGGMFLCLIPLNLLRLKKTQNIYVFAVLAVILLSSFFTFLGLREIGGNSFYKELESLIRPQNTMIIYGMLLVGISFILSLFFPVIFYFQFAIRKRRNEIVFGKSVMMGLGCLFFLSAVVSDYLFGLKIENFFATSTATSLLFMLGAVVFISSVVYRGEGKINNN
jgi:hypothetical protein